MVTQRSVQTLKASKAPVTSVTVFNNNSNTFNKRAEVTRIFKVSLKPGINEIQVEDIAKTIVENSISVVGQGHATILDVKLQTKNLMPLTEMVENQEKLKAELEECESKIEVEKDLFGIQQSKLSALKNMFNKYAEKKDGVFEKENGFSEVVGTNITNLFEFYEKNAERFLSKLREIKERGKILEIESEKLKEKIKLISVGEIKKSYISIEIDSETEAEGEVAELTLVYQVTGASWSPFYDIRVNTKSNESEVTLYYYANVQQQTGEDWKNIELSLSTAEPCINEALPTLGTTVVEFLTNTVPHSGYGGVSRSIFGLPHNGGSASLAFGGTSSSTGSLFGSTAGRNPASSGGLFGSSQAPAPPPRPPTPPPPPMKKEEVITVAEENLLSTTFTISRKSTIPSNFLKYKVTIGTEKVVAYLHHECIPKKDKKVYLMASVNNTTDYPLLPGVATVYIDSSLTTTFNLKSVLPGDKFDCALGVDKSVTVIYKPTVRSRVTLSSGVFSNYLSTVNEQKIVIKNAKKAGPVLITVYEPIPKSTNERIKLRVTAPDPIKEKPTVKKEAAENVSEPESLLPPIGPFLDEKHNLMWTEKLQPEEEKEMIIKWAVDYPQNEIIKFTEQ